MPVYVHNVSPWNCLPGNDAYWRSSSLSFLIVILFLVYAANIYAKALRWPFPVASDCCSGGHSGGVAHFRADYFSIHAHGNGTGRYGRGHANGNQRPSRWYVPPPTMLFIPKVTESVLSQTTAPCFLRRRFFNAENSPLIAGFLKQNFPPFSA